MNNWIIFKKKTFMSRVTIHIWEVPHRINQSTWALTSNAPIASDFQSNRSGFWPFYSKCPKIYIGFHNREDIHKIEWKICQGPGGVSFRPTIRNLSATHIRARSPLSEDKRRSPGEMGVPPQVPHAAKPSQDIFFGFKPLGGLQSIGGGVKIT